MKLEAVLKMLNLSVNIISNHTATTHNTFEEKGRKLGSWIEVVKNHIATDRITAE
jgi:hypothetical protein